MATPDLMITANLKARKAQNKVFRRQKMWYLHTVMQLLRMRKNELMILAEI